MKTLRFQNQRYHPSKQGKARLRLSSRNHRLQTRLWAIKRNRNMLNPRNRICRAYQLIRKVSLSQRNRRSQKRLWRKRQNRRLINPWGRLCRAHYLIHQRNSLKRRSWQYSIWIGQIQRLHRTSGAYFLLSCQSRWRKQHRRRSSSHFIGQWLWERCDKLNSSNLKRRRSPANQNRSRIINLETNLGLC